MLRLYLCKLNLNIAMANLKANKLIIKKLFSNNVEDILFAIKGLRNTGNVEILPYLITLLNENDDKKVKNALASFFNDIKSKKIATQIIDAIKNDKFKKIHHVLLSSCWQSNLDYSNYFNVFIDKFISGTYIDAIETLTIIENFDRKINDEEIQNSISKLKSEINNITADKKELLVELVHVLESM